MDFTYVGSGGFKLGGCAVVRKEACYNHKYEVGSTVYICDKAANKGKLEPIYIKKVRINFDKFNFPVVVYQEKNNRCFLEYELCTHQEALELAIMYHEDQLLGALEFIESQCG
jgi:hypothetical protein